MAEEIKEGLMVELDGFRKDPRALSSLTNIRTSLAGYAVIGKLTREETGVVYDRLLATEDGYETLANSGSIFHRNQWEEYTREELKTPRPFENWWTEQVQREIDFLNRPRNSG